MGDGNNNIDIHLPGSYHGVFEAALSRLAAERAVQRLWAGDPSLWYSAPDTQRRIKNSLGWLHLPATLLEIERTLRPLREHMLRRRIAHVLYVAPGFLGRAAHLWNDSFPAPAEHFHFHILDSVDPLVVQPLLAELQRGRTQIVIAASPRSAAEQILDDILSSVGQGIRLPLPDDVGDRFATLASPGLGLAALRGLDFAQLQARALHMQRLCQSPATDLNPGLRLGAALGVLAQQGHDLLLLAAPPELKPLAAWIEALVAGSLSKHLRGFVPIMQPDVPVSSAHTFIVQLAFDGATHTALTERRTPETHNEQPTVRVSLAGTYDLAAQVVVWQCAVAVAALLIGLNPFDAPDADVLNARVRQVLRQPLLPCGGAPPERGFTSEDMMALRRARFVAIAGYVAPQFETHVERLRFLLQQTLGVPIIVVYPSCDAHFSLQLLHAGRPRGVVVALWAVQNAAASLSAELWRLHAAQCAQLKVELEAWRHMGRSHIYVDLGVDPIAGFERLYATLIQT